MPIKEKRSRSEELQDATKFLQSVRGQYIVSQALCLAIKKMEEVEPETMREVSNIHDMEYLRDTLFPIFKAVQTIDTAVQDAHKND